MDLRRGQTFQIDGQEGTLEYVNESRAHVRLADKEITVGQVTFRRTVLADWSPKTVVEVEKRLSFDDI
jgi:hypothetical protein